MRRMLFSIVLGLTLALPAAPAFGQTTAGGSGTPPVVNCGSAATGGTVSCTIGGFPPNSDVTINVNGTGGLVKKADEYGNVHISVTITSQTTGTLGDPVPVTIQCGTN